MFVYQVLVNAHPAVPAAMLENSNRDISATGDPIHSVFGSRVGFSGSSDRIRMALFSSWTKFNRFVGVDNARGVGLIRLVAI